GSVKDRLAIGVIEAAEKSGQLKPGQTVIEATSGNTGIGLAMVCAAKGYPLVVIMAEPFSVERRRLMRFLGAKVVITPAAERAVGMIKKMEELAAAHGWFMTRQFENEANPDYHSRTTARRPRSSSASRRMRNCWPAESNSHATPMAHPPRRTPPSSRIQCRVGP